MTKSILKIGIKKRPPLDANKLYNDIEIMYNTYIDQSIQDYDLPPQILEEIMIICKKII